MDKELVSLRIDQILKHIDLVTSDLSNVNLENFGEYSLLARAIAFSLEQICEHVTKLRKKYECDYPNIEWDKIYDMRIVLAHMYMKIDTDIVYKTVKQDLPLLKKQMLEIKSTL